MDVYHLDKYGAKLPSPLRGLIWGAIPGLSASPAGAALVIALNLSQRLRGPHPARPPPEVVTQALLDSVTYDDIDLLRTIPKNPTYKGYAIIGGSGFIGTYIVRLLLMRGETSIRILDQVPPAADLLENSAVAYVPMDITSRTSVEEALLAPFASIGAQPSVIYYCGASARFWERAGYTWAASYRVNVQGAANVVNAARTLPKGTTLIYTSSSDVVIPVPRPLQFEGDNEVWPYNTTVVSDADPPLPPSARSSCCDPRSKAMAENIILDANSEDFPTSVLRPGVWVIGPNDRLLTSTLKLPRVPVWDNEWSHTSICVWDCAAAHLCLESALQAQREQASGQAFLITGEGSAWTLRDIRRALKHYSSRTLVFDEMLPMLVYIMAHLIEAFLYLRYYILLPFFLLAGSFPSLEPKWMGTVAYLQPTTLDYLRDVVIEDTRARKVIGYRPQWNIAQVIKWAAEEYATEEVSRIGGLT